jgi:oligosaccharyltransferase complex subunit beta
VYRIKDEIVYSMMVEQLEGENWVPFVSDDMQMEFMMLDAYVRKTMVIDPVNGKHVASFTAPDSYGIFKFRVLYRRVGYSVLHAETQVSIRPFKHNEYERFIFSAYPYYSSSFSAMIAFFVFSMFFLFSEDKEAKKI